MKKFGKVVVKLRIPILVLSFLLLIPSVLGYFNTRVNYDILYYLPSDIDTMQGQDILLDDFGKGAYAMVVVDGMNKSNVSKLVKKVEGVDHVASVISYSGIVGDDVPSEILPDKFRSYFENEDSGATLFAIFFDDTTSSDDTMKAIQEVRDVTDNQCYIAGMSAVVTDTKTMAEKETPFYVLVAVVLVCIVLAIFMDSFLVPVFFMLSIGMAIVYNLGSNYFLGEVSYITKALAAVLQLGVTLDYSIFLWHSYKEAKEETPDNHQEAMAVAIGNTLTSVVGSSITTVAGFIALCFMSFTLGLDLGVVMAKGVVLGVIGCVTILPSFILTFDKALEKTMHREIMPNFDKPARWIVNHSWIFLIIFVLLLGPAIYGYNNTKVYYDLSDTLPEKLNCSQANKLLADNFDGTNSIYMILADSNLSAEDSNAMMNEVNDLDGISFALSIDSALGGEIPTEMLPDSLVSELKGDEYQIMMVSTNYTIASDEINDQIDKVDAIAKKYDAKSMVIGEAPCTKDLITITDKDFKTVSARSLVQGASYKSLKGKISLLSEILDNAYGKSYCQISNPTLIGNTVDLGISDANKGKSRAITHSFGIKLRALMLGEEAEITFCDAQGTKKKYKFTDEERLSFVLFGILYASRCNNFHGNVAARMNSINANRDTFRMYTDMFLTEYIILAIHMNSQGTLSNKALNEVGKNVNLMTCYKFIALTIPQCYT